MGNLGPSKWSKDPLHFANMYSGFDLLFVQYPSTEKNPYFDVTTD